MILLVYAAIILFGIGLDQFTKYLAVTNLIIDESPDVPVWEGVFHIRCISNDGAAFGMLDDHRWIFMSVSTVVIIGVLVMLVLRYKKIPTAVGIALALVVSGGIGNMIDRISLGYVVDFIYFVPIDFPCFNVADALVCIGAALMFVCVLFMKDPEKEKAKTAETSDTEALSETESAGQEEQTKKTEPTETDSSAAETQIGSAETESTDE